MKKVRSGFNLTKYIRINSPGGSPCVSGEVVDLSNVDSAFARVSSFLYGALIEISHAVGRRDVGQEARRHTEFWRIGPLIDGNQRPWCRHRQHLGLP